MTKPPRSLPHPFRSLPRRWDLPEILDDPLDVGQEAFRRSYTAMARVNLRLGGTRSLLHHLEPLLEDHSQRAFTLLDVGVGSGAVPATLAGAALRKGIRLSWIGLDLSRRVLTTSRSLPWSADDPPLVQGDGLALPFRAGAFDVVTSSLTLHHLTSTEARAFLVEAARVARLGVLVSDLERHPAHYLGARLLAATWWRRDPVTRYDGPASVLRAFTRRELEEVAEDLPFSRVRVKRHIPFRLVLEGRVP